MAEKESIERRTGTEIGTGTEIEVGVTGARGIRIERRIITIGFLRKRPRATM